MAAMTPMGGMAPAPAMDGMEIPGGQSPAAQMALGAMGQSPPMTPSIQRLEEGFSMCHKILMAMLPQLTQMKPDLGKSAHAAARMILELQGQVRKETAPSPPPDYSFGMAPGGPMGSPSTGPV